MFNQFCMLLGEGSKQLPMPLQISPPHAKVWCLLKVFMELTDCSLIIHELSILQKLDGAVNHGQVLCKDEQIL